MTKKQAEFYVGSKPFIPISIQDAYGQWQVVYMLVDWGNDITLISANTAARLGFMEEAPDGTLPVQGVFGEPQQAIIREGVIMQIGETNPFATRILITDTEQNLLGREFIDGRFDVMLSNDRRIIFFDSTVNEDVDLTVS
jgi:hypothetical protein